MALPLNNDSDYNLPYTRLQTLLPEVFQSDVALALYDNLFNRFLTKRETVPVIGFIGPNIPGNSVVQKPIQEPTLDRQAQQLQPIMNTTIGTEKFLASWDDLEGILTRLGVNVSQQNVWGAVQEFNWVPPIDIDKLINYRNYFWVDATAPNSPPDYIVMRNPCIQATAVANFWQNLTTTYGTTFPIVAFGSTVNPPVEFSVVSISGTTITISGNATQQLANNQFFTLTGTLHNDGTYETTAAPVFTQSSNTTAVTVGSPLVAESGNGFLQLLQFNQFVVNGNFTQLFAPNFMFSVDSSSNPQIQSTVQTVVSSTYNGMTGQTTLTLKVTFSDPLVSGVVSLVEALTAAITNRDCICSGELGWDVTQWDDNPNTPPSPIWGPVTPIAPNTSTNQPSLISAISHSTTPSLPPSNTSAEQNLWYDTTNDQLYQWSGSAWIVIATSFSTIIANTSGNNYWDLSAQCANPETIVPAATQWIQANNWVHEVDVPNFTIARRAQFPIIEFVATLEMNEWLYTSFNWQYRSNTNVPFAAVTPQPALIELESLNLTNVTGTSPTFTFYLDDDLGDQTAYFTPGRQFAASNDPFVTGRGSVPPTSYLVKPITTIRSWFVQLSGQECYRTAIECSSPDPHMHLVNNTFSLVPIATSVGDTWKGYNVHWLFLGANDEVPVNHQTLNYLLNVQNPTVTTVGTVQYTSGPFSQINTLMSNGPVPTFNLSTAAIPGSSQTLTTRALLGANDVRVYVNGVRQYGTYVEISTDSIHVTGITFLTGYIPTNAGTVVTIQVGSASMQDLGDSQVPVLVKLTNGSFAVQTMSLIVYRKNEQIKTGINQYPLFDLYNPNGQTAFKASQIFAYETSQTQPIAPGINARIIQSNNPLNFNFEQFLVDYDNGNLYAYRDFAKQTENYWVNINDPDTASINVWTGFNWDTRFNVTDTGHNTYYTTGTVGALQPAASDFIFGCLNYLWYDSTAKVLNFRVADANLSSDFIPVNGVFYLTFDNTLNTVWRAGTNHEEAVPTQVDWADRTLAEYNSQQAIFVAAQENAGTSPSLAEQNWLTSQINPFSPTGEWVGVYPVPDPMYYNNLHENRKIITYTQLLTHFDSIIESQPIIPGFTGSTINMFHLLPSTGVNYGLGGKIKEYNDGFDTFLSSIYEDVVNPLDLVDFAREQYDDLLTNLQTIYTKNLISYLTTISQPSLENLTTFIENSVITNFEENEYFSLLFGDSATFNQQTMQGVLNWINTLVYNKLIEPSQPLHLIDIVRSINTISHHDTHLASYALPPSSVEGFSRLVTQQPDNRNGPDTFGRISTTTPPTTIAAFNAAFATTIVNREGVYWFYTPFGVQPHVLYRLTAVNSGPFAPVTTVPLGSLWIDTGTNTLRVLIGTSPNSWVPVTSVGDGIITSAWEVVDLNLILNDIVLETEDRLFENAPDFDVPVYNLSALPSLNPTQYQANLEIQFLNYAASNNITNPFQNTSYVPTDPFSWNYTNSSVGTGYGVVGTDPVIGSFTIDDPQGLFAPTFVAGDTFFVKNSNSSNDGTWTISSSGAVFNPSTLKTTIYVVVTPIHTVAANAFGLIYHGDLLPSTFNTGAESAGFWQALYNAFYGTPFPHLEPWRLQGYYTKPTWWDSQYSTGGTRPYWITSMWTNILNGVIPAGETYPNGVTSITGNPATDRAPPNLLDVPDLPHYHYFSVNITASPIVGNDGVTYAPGDLFPPYWAGPFQTNVRSLFTSQSEIVSPGADYVFGEPGPIEWQWRTSTTYLYDLLKIAFIMDPVRMIAHTFGKSFYIVDELQVDTDTNNTFSHTRTNFNGDIVNNQPYFINGLNQWYVNFNRFTSNDISYGDFRALWTSWTAPLTYQLSSFIDTASLILGQQAVPITSFDWNIESKHTSGAEDFWQDALKVTATFIPPQISRYNNESQWEFVINTNLPLSRTISYYDVQNYQFCNLYTQQTVDGILTPSNVFSIYTYPVIAVDTINNTFSVQGDQTGDMSAGMTFSISGSSNNDGSYTIKDVAYDQSADTTIVTVTSVITGDNVLGLLKLNYRTLPWQTGQIVYITTDETSPTPLQDNNYYFVIMLSPTTFMLAFTKNDAISNNPLTITTVGRRNQYVGVVQSTFLALNGQVNSNQWAHYAIDTTNILSFSTPATKAGVQHIINIVDGYYALQTANGWVINANGSLIDPVQGIPVSWQLEEENFINYIFAQRQARIQVPQASYPVSINVATSEFTYTENPGQFLTGNAVQLISPTQLFPPPLLGLVSFYIIVDSPTTFRLAGTQQDAINGNAITVENVPFAGSLSVIPAPSATTATITYELNAFRNGLWFRPNQGIVANIFKGASDSLINSQLTFDQYGRPLSPKITRVFRHDQQTQITVIPNVANDVNPSVLFPSPYNNIHLGGIHIFIDTYENVIVFNNYTTQGVLIYDPFVGLNITPFQAQFNRQDNFTQRPNVGGYFLSTFFNQNPQLTENIEANIEDLRYMYDVFQADETDPIIQFGRTTVGFNGLLPFLSEINMNPKSQFIFYRGLIKQKGSINAVNAFLNSVLFQGAIVDEFWAVKLADFGSAAEKIYPAVYLTTLDARSNQIRLQFVTEDDLCDPGYSINVYDDPECGYSFPTDGSAVLVGNNGFTPILITDQTRFFRQPDVNAELAPDGGTMYFTLKVDGQVPIAFVSDSTSFLFDQDYVRNVQNHLNTSLTYEPYEVQGQGLVYADTSVVTSPTHPVYTFWIFEGDSFNFNGYWDSSTNSNREIPTLRHGFKADAIQITLTPYPEAPGQLSPLPTQIVHEYTGNTGHTLNVVPYIPFTGMVQIYKKETATSPHTVVPLISGVDYAEVLDTGGNLFSTQISFPVALVPTDVITVIYGNATLVEGLHYNVLNSDIIQFLNKQITDGAITTAMNLTIWGLIENEHPQNPAKIIDTIAQTVITPVQLWDPARGLNYVQAQRNIDLSLTTDPARYTNTLVTQPTPTVPIDSYWATNQVGTTWYDTALVQYQPYYDPTAITNIDVRFQNWGALAGWANVNVLEWVKSTVPPSQFNAIAAQQQGDTTIPETLRYSGVVNQTLFRKVSSSPTTWDRFITQFQNVNVAIEGTPIPYIGIPAQYEFRIDPTILQTSFVNAVVAVGSQQFTVAGNQIQNYITGTSFGYFDGNPHNTATYTVASSTFNGVDTLVSVSQQFVGSPSTSGYLVSLVDVYLNGVAFLLQQVPSVFVVEGTPQLFLIFQATQIRLVDQLTFVIKAPTDTSIIQAGVTAGVWAQEYEFTQVPFYDSLGNLQFNYYFWVSDKITTNVDETLSPATVTQDLVNIPVPYLFYQNVMDPTTQVVNGFTVPLPLRYVQVIIAGLRGIIDADNRYVIRFLRDYTLRDNLDWGNKPTIANGTPLALKNKHHHWLMIRPQQASKIPEFLWTDIIESMIGFNLKNPQILVPSLNRQLYDVQFNSDTSYGLTYDDEAFCNGPQALAIVQAYLTNTANNFAPIDINLFLQTHSFDTPANIIEAMNEIYTSFSALNVNEIFFAILKNAALPYKKEYENILKTSMLSVTGVVNLGS